MSRLLPYLGALRDRYGLPSSAEQGAPFEPFVRAILAPGASARSLEKAIRALKIYGLLDLGRIRELDPDTIAMAIKPAGSAHAKAHRLKTFVAWFVDRFGADEERLKALAPSQLRDELLEIGGIGPETADLLLLVGLGLPSAAVDTYTYRVLTRHEFAVEDVGYDDLKDLVEKNLPRDRETLVRFRLLIDQVGREYCRPKARCEGCPLQPYLPPGK